MLKFNSESFSEIGGVLHNTKLSSIKGLPNKGQLDNSGFKLGIFRDLLIKDNLLYNNIIFIFNGIAWCNIVYLFKCLNISIYGGSSARLIYYLQFSQV